jgi:cell division septum initiation protein DivIVA
MVLSASNGMGTGGSTGGGHHPKVAGDLDELLNERPVFRVKLNGYDRLEVDNYAAWAEGELAGLRREVDHLLARFGACSAELEISRRLLADAARGREVYPVTARVEGMLRLASEEAAAMREAGAEEAERIVAEARAEADARLRKAHDIKEMAVRSADEILEHARRDRAAAAAEVDRGKHAAAAELDRARQQAAAQLDRARQQAAEILAEAGAERDRVAAEAEAVRRHRDDAHEALLRLGDRIGEALQVVVGPLPEAAPEHATGVSPQNPAQDADQDARVRTVMVDNIVADPPPVDGERDGAELAGASAGPRAKRQSDRVSS